MISNYLFCPPIVTESHKGEDRDSNDNFKAKNDKKYPYPKGIPFIVSTEFCERFSYYGMKSKCEFTFSMYGFSQQSDIK